MLYMISMPKAKARASLRGDGWGQVVRPVIPRYLSGDGSEDDGWQGLLLARHILRQSKLLS